MQTLLVSCQRVDKTVKSIIDGSRDLQKALWFLPDPDFKIDNPEFSKTTDRERCQIFWRPTTTESDARNPLIVKFANRIGIRDFDYMFYLTFGRAARKSAPVPMLMIGVCFTDDEAAAICHKDSSWGKMILFQGLEVDPKDVDDSLEDVADSPEDEEDPPEEPPIFRYDGRKWLVYAHGKMEVIGDRLYLHAKSLVEGWT